MEYARASDELDVAKGKIGVTIFPQTEVALEADEVDPVVEALAWCLEHENETLMVIRRHFYDHAGRRGLTMHRAKDMMPRLEAELGIGDLLTPNLDLLLARFDFDGDRRIDEAECLKMVMVTIKQGWLDHTGDGTDAEVPEKSVGHAGYVIEKELGQRGQGMVYLASQQMSSQKYFLKSYDKGEANAVGLEELKEEFRIMQRLHHVNLGRTFEVFQDYSHFYIVSKAYFGGDLSELGRRALGKVNTHERWWRGIFAQCLDGLAYLHSNAVMHCDIKETNIVVSRDDGYKAPMIKLVDFGVAVGFLDKSTGLRGTPGYIPPETWQSGLWYPRGDIFSLGVVFFQLLTGCVPTAYNRVPGLFTEGAKSVQDIARITQEHDVDWEKFPHWGAAMDMVSSMLHKHMGERPVAIHLIQHRWFSEDTDGIFPPENAYRLYGRATEELSRRAILDQLEEKNNLRKLRRLQQKLDGLANGHGFVPANGFMKLMLHAGVDEEMLGEYVKTAHDDSQGGRVPYSQLLHDAIVSKTKYTDKDVLDMFVVADVDGKGYLQREEVEALFHNNLFEVDFSDIEQLMAQIDMDDDGNIDFYEFRRAVLEDGRICRKSASTCGGVRGVCTSGCQAAHHCTIA